MGAGVLQLKKLQGSFIFEDTSGKTKGNRRDKNKGTRGNLASDTYNYANSKYSLTPGEINLTLKFSLPQFLYLIHHVWLSMKNDKAC